MVSTYTFANDAEHKAFDDDAEHKVFSCGAHGVEQEFYNYCEHVLSSKGRSNKISHSTTGEHIRRDKVRHLQEVCILC